MGEGRRGDGIADTVLEINNASSIGFKTASLGTNHKRFSSVTNWQKTD
jgi:hypothetical protein